MTKMGELILKNSSRPCLEELKATVPNLFDFLIQLLQI
jgi:hypothetical protein